MFGTDLDDDIVSTAGRLAAADADGNADARLSLVYVVEVPLALPLDAGLPSARRRRPRARARPRSRGGVRGRGGLDAVLRARDVGAGIVEAARRGGSEAIVVGAEPPTQVRGGAALGGIGGSKPAEIGAATQYVLKKAPCQVLLTAPPETPT